MPTLHPKPYICDKRNRSHVATIHLQNNAINHKYIQPSQTLSVSVNSVRTPVNQHQLLNKARQLSTIIERDKSACSGSFSSTSSSSPPTHAPHETRHSLALDVRLYPGKRYLYTDDSMRHDGCFTDTICSPPTPTETTSNVANDISKIIGSFENATIDAESRNSTAVVITNANAVDRLRDKSLSLESSGSLDQPWSDSEESLEGGESVTSVLYSSLDSI